MGESFCSDCKKATEVVTDWSVGDSICTECGLVIEAYSIDETSEWRTFADESNNNIDPVRVGEPTNTLLNEGWFSTIISKPNGFINSSDIIMSNFDKMLTVAFKKIDTMAERLGLVARIKTRANEIYKDFKSQRSKMRRNKEDALMAACIFIACRREELPRTSNEIWPVANGATKNEIIKAASLMERQRTK